MKTGVKLPRNDNGWNEANAFFQASLSCDEVGNKPLDEVAVDLNNTVYNYFKENCGSVKNAGDTDEALLNRFKDLSKAQLKRELKRLKSAGDEVEAIKIVAKLLRNKINNNSPNDNIISTDHDLEVSKNFWSYCKRFLNYSQQKLLSFNKQKCQTFFKSALSCAIPRRIFGIPDWIPRFNAPTHQFDLKPPSYHEINKIIKRMKASGSPCPLDQISIICFKRCPYLRSYLLAIFKEIWKQKYIPTCWRKACTILIHKKDATDDPSNFRPITLESVMLKIFTSFMRNRMYDFLVKNKYIESSIQKGFVPGMSGTFEHISHLTHVINQARNKQKSVTITLIDLQNAFGEVSHNLIDTVLEYHHMPPDVRELFKALYGSFHTSITTKGFSTNFIKVSKGVLQGDCLSPLLFNLTINTFIQYIKSPEFSQLGYYCIKSLTPRHWYQFADDAVAATGTEHENQILLNAFTMWCNWASMIIKPTKCKCFGIRKVNDKAQQVKPHLYLNNIVIKTVDIDESFVYLGRYFNFEMNNVDHKNILIEELDNYLNKLDELPLHPRNKIKIYQLYILSKIAWHLTVADIPITWVKQNLDNRLSSHLRTWLTIPISGSLNIITLSQKKFGLSILTPSTKFTQCQTTFRLCLKNSVNVDIRRIYEETSKNCNIQYDCYKSTREALKDIRDNTVTKIKNKLSTQKLVISAIWKDADDKFTKFWYKALKGLPRGIYNFTIRYLNNTLPNATNTAKWNTLNDNGCPLCHSAQSLGHVVAGCKTALEQLRYNWRHDSILACLGSFIPKGPLFSLYIDIPGFNSPSIITGDADRPDFLVITEKVMWILELTAGFETNISKNFDRKEKRYSAIVEQLRATHSVKYVNLSMGALGIIGKNTNLLEMLDNIGITGEAKSYNVAKLINICIRCTYFIFCCRNKDWSDPKLLSW